MRRKLVKHGPSSLTISLPMKWVKKNNLHSGDEIDVLEKGVDLLVTGHGRQDPREITIHIGDKDEFIKRLFVMPYVRGYDIITIRFESSNVLEQVQKHINMLYGFEIIDQGKTFCTIKNIAESKPEELDSMQLRMFNLVVEMLNDLKLYVKDNDKDAASRIQLMEKNSNKIDLFCRRLINKGGGVLEMKKAGSTYTILRILEEMGDIAADIARMPHKIRDRYMKSFARGLDKIITGFDLLKKIKYKGQLKHIHEYMMIEHALRKAEPLEKDLKPAEMKFFMQIRQLSYKLHDLSEEVILWAEMEKSL